MADNNPGEQRYQRLVDPNQGSARDVEQMAANDYSTDYSALNTDYSSGRTGTPSSNQSGSLLSNLENQAEQSQDQQLSGDVNRRDIGTEERSASFQSKGFDGSLNKSNLNSKQRRRFSSFKKKAIAAGIGLFAAGGLFLSGFTIVSGPMQLVQAQKLVQDFQLGVANAQKATRSFSNMKNIARSSGANSMTDLVQRSRLGILGNKQADAMIKRLGDKGITFDAKMFSHGGITVDPSTFGLDADKISDVDLDKIAKDMDVPREKLSLNEVDIDGKIVKSVGISDSLSYSEARRVISSIDDPGKTGLRGWMQSRATLKKLGYVSWLHPIEKAKAAAWKKVGDFLEWAGKGITKGVKKLSNVISSGDGKWQEYLEKYKTKGRGVLGKAKSAAGKLSDALTSVGKTLEWPLMFLLVFCMANSIQNEIGPWKQNAVVNVAEKGAGQIMGLGSQVQSGEDISMEAAGFAVKGTMGDNIEQLDENGDPANPPEYKYSSFWDAAPICATLGTAGCSTDTKQNVPQALKVVADDTSHFTGNETIDKVLSAFTGNIIADAVCAVYNLANDIVDNLISIIAGPVMELISSIPIVAALNDAIAGVMNSLFAYLFGAPLDIENITPQEWGSVAMYGGKFTSNDQMLGSGGKELSGAQALELNLENRRYLAWENGRKSVMARLFDPSDYNSSLNQMARAIHINTSDQKLTTQLANVFKVFTSAPSMLATATNQVFGSAYAASAYDYGVSTFAWDAEEMNNLSDGTGDYEMFNNANKALTLLDNEDKKIPNDGDPLPNTKYHDYAEDCLGVHIDKEDQKFKVSLLDNEDGTAWNYVNFKEISGECAKKADQPNYQSVRLYIMDYFNTVSGMCYEGDADDSDSTSACNEMEVGTNGPSGGVASGNQDPAAYQQEFADYMHEHGGVSVNGGDPLTVCYNGCVTVPAWFVTQHTDLTYGGGNGWQVASNLASTNGLELKNTLDGDCKLPAVFSSYQPAMGSVSNCGSGGAPNGKCGHTGLVISMDSDGTIKILESGSSQCGTDKLSWIQTRTRSEWEGNAEFVCLGDHLK